MQSTIRRKTSFSFVDHERLKMPEKRVGRRNRAFPARPVSLENTTSRFRGPSSRYARAFRPEKPGNSLTTHRVVVSAVAIGTFPRDPRQLTRRARILSQEKRKNGASAGWTDGRTGTASFMLNELDSGMRRLDELLPMRPEKGRGRSGNPPRYAGIRRNRMRGDRDKRV